MLMYAMLLCVSCRGDLADCAQRLAAKVAWHSALAKLPRKVSGSLPDYCLLLFSPLCCPLTLSHTCHAAAEGEGYGSGKAYGNSTAYLAFAGVQTGLAGLMAALPESVRPVCSGVLAARLAPCHHVHMLGSAALPWPSDKLATPVI